MGDGGDGVELVHCLAEAKEQRTLRTGGKAAPETTAHIYRMSAP